MISSVAFTATVPMVTFMQLGCRWPYQESFSWSVPPATDQILLDIFNYVWQQLICTYTCNLRHHTLSVRLCFGFYTWVSLSLFYIESSTQTQRYRGHGFFKWVFFSLHSMSWLWKLWVMDFMKNITAMCLNFSILYSILRYTGWTPCWAWSRYGRTMFAGRLSMSQS